MRKKGGYLRKYFRGHHLGNWKNGKVISSDGYILVKKRYYLFADLNGYVREHRLIYEEYFKCCLLLYVDIHHKDGNKQNNCIENLQPLYHDQHASIRHKK